MDEDENRIKLQQQRLQDAEKRNAVILKEIDELRKELDELRTSNNKLSKDNLDQKE